MPDEGDSLKVKHVVVLDRKMMKKSNRAIVMR
jgi:hypothetical protein